MKKYIFYFLFFVTFIKCAYAQEQRRNVGWAVLPYLGFSFQTPSGNLAERFGRSNGVGGGVDYLSAKRNIILGVETNFIFGTTVKEDVLAGLRDPDGEIIGNSQSQTSVALRQRGLYVGALVGKLFGLLSNNPRSGIRATMGVGYFRHRIRLQDDNQAVVQISGDYTKGYDRLTGGITLSQFIGYQHLATNRRINLTAGFEFLQCFSKSLRGFNYDTQKTDKGARLDLLYGFKVALTLPFYIGEDAEQIDY